VIEAAAPMVISSAETPDGLPRITWIPTGGTIQCVGRSALEFDDYASSGSTLSAEELLNLVPQVADMAHVTVVNTPEMSSHSVGIDSLFQLAALVEDLESNGTDGIVLTCGTNGLEEIAFFLSLFNRKSTPLVITAAMRPPHALGTDALLNLWDACLVSTRRELVGYGPVIVMDRQILDPATASKFHTHHPRSFRSTSGESLGYISTDNEVRVTTSVADRRFVELGAVRQTLPRVDIVTSHLGADSMLIEACVEAGSAGIVSAGFGAGLVTPEELKALKWAAEQGVVICQSRRTPEGTVLSADASFIKTGGLTPQKARLLLSVALGTGLSDNEIRDTFAQY
jgi:L-asparaginase/Glu-tRNA(Gln) amidotransferase subunit D